MMGAVVFTTALVTVAIVALWVFRTRAAAGVLHTQFSSLHKIDLLAFRNLLSEDDDQYLRGSLTPAAYHQVRRARVRAAQQYLVWIAQDCAIWLVLLRSQVRQSVIKSDGQPEALVRTAIQLRLAALFLWCLLWVEYLVPGLEIKPYRTVRNYEQFWHRAELSLSPALYTHISS